MCGNFWNDEQWWRAQNVLFGWHMTFAYANALSAARRPLYDGDDASTLCVCVCVYVSMLRCLTGLVADGKTKEMEKKSR